jgi:hypothetical protein
VKNLARLVLFFTLSFVIILIFAGMIRILWNWVDAARLISVQSGENLEDLVTAARSAIPAALYCSLLGALSYAARRRIPYLLAVFVLLVLSLGFTAAASLGISRLGESAPPWMTFTAPPGLGEPGLIVSQPDRVTVFLDDPQDTGGIRVIALPGQPLYYQISAPMQERLRLPFRVEQSRILDGLLADFSLSAHYMEAWFNVGLLPLGIYCGSLILLLISVGFVLNWSSWPLANLFFGALAFRGVLAFEALLNSRDIHFFLTAFLGALIPESLISPLIFCVLGLLIILYTVLVYLAKGKRGRRTRNGN